MFKGIILLYTIEVSEDFLTCYLVKAFHNEGYSTYEEIQMMAEAQGITVRLNEGLIQEIIDEEKDPERTIIAQGNAPQRGRDGELKFKVDVSAKARFIPESDNERVDYKNAMKRTTVKKGDQVAIWVNATKGVSGLDLLGRSLPAEDGKEIQVRFGDGIEQRKNEFLATRGGVPRWLKGVLTVDETLRIEGGVNMASGNIRSAHTVVIDGNVDEGFEVESEGDVYIYGSFFGVSVRAKGHVLITGGVGGKDKSTVCAEGRIETLFANNAQLEAKEAIMITKDCIHSRVFSLDSVHCNGSIMGGEVKALKEVVARKLGSELSGVTQIGVGVHFELENMMVQRMNMMEEAQTIKDFYRSAMVNGILPKEYKEKLEKDIEKIDEMIARVEKIDAKVLQWKTKMELKQAPMIKVLEGVNMDVQFRAPHCFMEFGEMEIGQSLYRANLEERTFELVR